MLWLPGVTLCRYYIGCAHGDWKKSRKKIRNFTWEVKCVRVCVRACLCIFFYLYIYLYSCPLEDAVTQVEHTQNEGAELRFS